MLHIFWKEHMTIKLYYKVVGLLLPHYLGLWQNFLEAVISAIRDSIVIVKFLSILKVCTYRTFN
jgi:hypothetical protein